MYGFLTVLVSIGWTFGAALVVLALISPRIPRTWAWSEIRHARRRVMLAGVGMVLGATAIFLGIFIVFAWRALQTGA